MERWCHDVQVPEIKTLVLKTVWSLCNRKMFFACIAKKLERILILRCRLSFFLVNMYIVLIELKVKAFRRKQRQLMKTYWSHIKFLHINDQTWWRYIFFDSYFSFALSPEELWRTKKWKRLSSWKILFKVPTTSRIIEGSRSFLIFSLFSHALLLFLYFELKIEISWNSRSSKAKSSNDNFARNDVCNYIA